MTTDEVIAEAREVIDSKDMLFVGAMAPGVIKRLLAVLVEEQARAKKNDDFSTECRQAAARTECLVTENDVMKKALLQIVGFDEGGRSARMASSTLFALAGLTQGDRISRIMRLFEERWRMTPKDPFCIILYHATGHAIGDDDEVRGCYSDKTIEKFLLEEIEKTRAELKVGAGWRLEKKS